MSGIKTKIGKNVMLNRMYKSTPDYTAPSQFKVGTGDTAPTVNDTDLELSIPIGDGDTCDNGAQTLTGSVGGTNTTTNTFTFKPGADQTDDSAQNLLVNNTDVNKIWTLENLSTSGATALADKYTAFWLYIKDISVLQKFKTSGTCLNVKIGTDASNYYYKEFAVGSLVLGWNWVQLDELDTNLSTGTPTAPLNWFQITIITNNATDTFNEGDVIYDFLRQWETTDLFEDISSVAFNENTVTATITATLFSTQAVGYNLTEIGTFNTDATPKMDGRDTFSSEGKSSEDEFKFTIVDGLD